MDGWFGRWASRRAQASGRPTGRVRAQVSALIKVRHEEAGAILGISRARSSVPLAAGPLPRLACIPWTALLPFADAEKSARVGKLPTADTPCCAVPK